MLGNDASHKVAVLAESFEFDTSVHSMNQPRHTPSVGETCTEQNFHEALLCAIEAGDCPAVEEVSS